MIAIVLCNLLVPVIIFITGRLMWKHYPKNINGSVGYRTTRSMINMDTWKFANEYCGHLWYKMGIVMLILSIIISIFIYQYDKSIVTTVSLILMTIQCIVLIASIFPTEIALKKTFNEDGTRK